MNRPYDEQVSALADGELDRDELSLVLRRTRQDPALSRRLGRYALIRDALSRNLPPTIDESLADRVITALDDEPPHHGPAYRQDASTRRGRSWLAPVAGVAVAASVAMLGVIVWPGLQSDSASPQSVASAPPDGDAEVRTASTDNIRWDRLDPEVQARLNGYAISHGEEAAGRQVGIMPQHVRITGHSAERR